MVGAHDVHFVRLMSHFGIAEKIESFLEKKYPKKYLLSEIDIQNAPYLIPLVIFLPFHFSIAFIMIHEKIPAF